MNKLFAMVLCGFALVALQTNLASAQTIGAKVGWTSSNLDFDPDDPNFDLEAITSFGGGGFVRFGTAGLSLQLEVLALTKGTKASESGGEFKFKLNYVEVPLTAMFSLGKGPYVFGGPAVAFEISCKAEISGLGFDEEGDCDDPDIDAQPNRKKTDLGVVAGAGFQFALGPGNLLLEGRHTWGMSNINDDPNDPDTKIKNRSLAVMVGYAISLKR